ncbi:type II restriction endonuclease [uncultured Pseudoteredinibacter sp.]|uniref:type II restriction endonuclease n=1 Tax=uncultured Pseudoteredinibacter sp. TaxID=1641701 RepID=UPI00260F1499|nr:type II restriction endonuclease [uncultured Pseudoteredinibacter sp.]
MSDFGKLNDYIIGASVKRLSAVECNTSRSNQHELNGTKKMKSYLGEKSEYIANFIRLDDNQDKIESLPGKVTWYDARENHPTRSEYRLYYQSNPALELASAGDPLAVILRKDLTIIFVSAPKDSQSELELFDLFGEQISTTFKTFDFSDKQEAISVTKRFILEEIGIEVKANFGSNYLDLITERFGGLVFPKTKIFSALAREIAGSLTDFDTVDNAIIGWWETEEAMFRQLEGEIIERKLMEGFSNSDDFLAFSQTIRQRRNSRAGNALENHLAHLFSEKDIHHSWEPKTENNKKPDFLFPSIDNYLDPNFPDDNLTMLGVKTTCKDRWRQVLTEADRITEKHLFTLQPKISINQTYEMMSAKLQLVIPKSIHSTYTEEQRRWIWDFEKFVEHVSTLQTGS